MRSASIAILILTLSALACGGSFLATPTHAVSTIYPSVTSEATQEISVEVIYTPEPTAYVVITATPAPTAKPTLTTQLCVSAEETVNLRPSPNLTGYPIVQLKNGEQVVDLGGRQGEWVFVKIGKYQGWVNGKYLKECK